MAIHVVPDKVRTIWNQEEIRIVVMTSLLLQILLTLLAPLRKRMGGKLLVCSMWSFYLAADYVASFALGNILSGQIAFEDNTQSASLDAELLGFWAPFMLLHLGGPDTITSYSVEDNELWLRHFLGLAIQVSIVLLVLLYSSFSSRLLLAGTLLVFFAGFIKFAERIWALLLASNNSIKQTFLSIPFLTEPEINPTDHVMNPTDPVMISIAYYFFVSSMKSLFSKKSINNEGRIRSQRFIRECDSEIAFHVAEIEASFLHDILHTKASCLRALHGIAWRCGTLVMVMAAFLLFHLSEKQGYKKINVIITYILVCMGVLLEVISVLTMVVSDWTIAFLERKGHKKLARAISNVVQCAFRKPKPRRTNQIGQYNLIRAFIKSIHRPSIIRRLLRHFKLEDRWDSFVYANHVELEATVKDLIKQSIWNHHDHDAREPDYLEHTLKTIYKLEHRISESQWPEIRKIFFTFWDFDHGKGLIRWHIATELCYKMTNDSEQEDERIVMFKLNGYHLSNYLMYWAGNNTIIQESLFDEIKELVFGELKESFLGELKELLPGKSITEVKHAIILWITLINRETVYSHRHPPSQGN